MIFLFMVYKALLALSLRLFTALRKLPVATVSRWNLYLWSWQLDLFWNTIIFVLLRFTVRAQVWQNLCRRSRCCCRPSLVGEEAPDHQQTVDIWLQILVRWDRVLPIPWYIFWRGRCSNCIPVSAHGPVGRNLCFFANFNSTLVVCVHGFYNDVCFTANTTFHQFV